MCRPFFLTLLFAKETAVAHHSEIQDREADLLGASCGLCRYFTIMPPLVALGLINKATLNQPPYETCVSNKLPERDATIALPSFRFWSLIDSEHTYQCPSDFHRRATSFLPLSNLTVLCNYCSNASLCVCMVQMEKYLGMY